MQLLALLSFIKEIVNNWLSELSLLPSFTESQPHAAYCDFLHSIKSISFVTSNRVLVVYYNQSWTLLLTGIFNPRKYLVALPVRFGGLGLPKVTVSACLEHDASKKISHPLSDMIIHKNGSIK